jgi:thiol-disulfide isomerase/thioredoxin
MRVFATLLILFLLHGCGDDEQKTATKIEKNSSLAPQTNPKNTTTLEQNTPHPKESVETKDAYDPTQPSMDRYDKEIFSIHDFSQDASKAKKFIVYKEGVDFKNISQKVVILNFFSQNCTPCIGQFPYLSDLQNKYRKDLFLMGIMLDSKMDKKELSKFANDNHAVFFLGDSEQNTRLVETIGKQLGIKNLVLPLTVMYLNGAYYIHYEGAAPIEMIESDIAQALGKLQ